MKKYIVMSIAAACIVSSVSADNLKNVPMAKTYPVNAELKVVKKELVKKSIEIASAKPAIDYTKRIKALEENDKKLKKKINKLTKSLSKVKAHDSKDNIKWGVDFRTSLNSIEYTTAKGLTHKNDSIFSNRLWLNMAYAPSKNMIFKGQLSYHKAYGASPKGVFGLDQRGNTHSFDAFDWVTNENLTNDTIKLKEAYWLYMSDSLLGSDIDWTASFGRRPSTNGFLVNLRDNDKPASPMGHMINMEFDGASFKFGLEKVTNVSGMSWKICLGRGLTNARARFNMDTGFASSGDYSEDKQTLKNVDLAGFIFVPYDNGQYKLSTTYYRGFNVPGFTMADPAMMDPSADNQGMMKFVDNNGNGISDGMVLNKQVRLRNMGDIDGAAVSFLVDGIGNDLGDFADDVKLFASFGWSKSMPDNVRKSFNMSAMNQQIGQGVQQMLSAPNNTLTQEQATQQVIEGMLTQLSANPQAAASFLVDDGMMGSADDETGTSYWIGAQWPCLLVDDAKMGAEFNHGSKHWRPFTYGEDTLVGSKLAVRGDAYELYWSKKLMNSFTMQIRYTKIDYKYTGSQGFFGASGAPMSMAEAKSMGMDPIEEAQDIRVSLRYRF